MSQKKSVRQLMKDLRRLQADNENLNCILAQTAADKAVVEVERDDYRKANAIQGSTIETLRKTLEINATALNNRNEHIKVLQSEIQTASEDFDKLTDIEMALRKVIRLTI